jgi:tetratricopeptide (TPR) repeat protein
MSNEKFSKNPKKRKFSISLGTLMILPSLLVPIIFLITDYIQLKFTGVHVWELVRFWESDRTLCNNKLTDDQNEAKLIYESCQKVIDSTDNISTLNVEYKNAARAYLVQWDKSRDKNMNLVINRIKRYFSVAEELNQEDPQAKFYSAYMEDFEDFVQTPEKLDCLPASERYQEAIELYRTGDNIESVGIDFFAVLELGHFLVARDGRNGYEKALELYDKLQVSNKDANYIVLLDKGKAYFWNKEYSKARDSWQKALKIEPQDYQIKYYIGNSLALEERYDEAIKKYDEVTEDKNTKEYYPGLRDSGFAHYILHNYKEAKERFNRAIKILGNRGTESQLELQLMEKYLDKIEEGECDQGNFRDTTCYQEDKDRTLAKNDLKRQGVFTSISTVHRQDKPTDPFIEVEHDKFYKCRIKPEL